MRGLVCLGGVLCAAASFGQTAGEVNHSAKGYTTYGEWIAEASASPQVWAPGDTVKVKARLILGEQHLASFNEDKIKVDGFVMLATAERSFDSTGWRRLASDEKMSTILTPSGIPIEGGTTGAVSTRLGYGFKTPFDQLVKVALKAATIADGRVEATFEASQKLPDNLPPGIYRLRLDFGLTVGTRNYSLQAKSFGHRQNAIKGKTIESCLFLPPIPASGYDASGAYIDGTKITPRLPFVLLNSYNSNGNRGVVAEEDRRRFGLASRNLIQDDIVLPRYNTAQQAVSYSLEPQYPTETIETRTGIPWDGTRGGIAVEITAPDGKVTNLGWLSFIAKSGQNPTTRNSAVTGWRPAMYGRYTVKLQGTLYDIWGNRYEGGGTYKFWIANRMTMATATFQGMAYPVGSRYGRDIGFAPAVPADVTIDAELYVNSDPDNVRRASWSGKASAAGIYGSAQGAQNLLLDAPGEYYARILATYTDEKGHLWVCSLRHAGVVYPTDSPIVAHGKKFAVSGKYVERGETRFEGYYDTTEQIGQLVHFNFPWNSGDVLLIATEAQSANKITHVLTYGRKDSPMTTWETRLNSISATNLQLKTSNGYSPHLCPEYMTNMGYYYSSGPRPGFMGRFMVGEEGASAPYWPVSPNSFGGQFGASPNGDMPGDIYRLLGGVVLRNTGETPLYAGYLASAFIMPPQSHNNRVIAPGAEDLPGPAGIAARFFLVGTRPGMMYEAGAGFTPAVQIDPILPAAIKFRLRYPDGKEATSTATGDAFGSAVGTRWTLDQPGIYKFFVEGEWEGHRGVMPGLPAHGGDIYVVEKGRPVDAPAIKFNLPVESTFDVTKGTTITGTSTAESVYYAAVIPGAVIDQGYLPVSGGKFEYIIDPKKFNQATQTYDIENRVSGKAELGDIVHLTFFSKEKAANGTASHSFARIILRGNRIVCSK